MKKHTTILLLVLIVLSGGILRYTHINWDSFKAFHPDERNISWAVTRIHFFDQLNPQFFAYGGLPVYLYRAIGEGVVWTTQNARWLRDWGYIAVIGRSVSATLSTTTIVLMYLVGAAYFSPAVGLTAAALLAFSPWAIQQAHFATTETMLVFFLLSMVLVARTLFRAIRDRPIIQLAVIWGLALAAKTTSVVFGIIPAAAIWLPFLTKAERKKNSFFNRFGWTIVLVAIAALVFFAFSPYTVLDFIHFRESMTYESGVALGRFTVPYTVQFLHTAPYLYQFTTMLWQAGPVAIIGIIGLAGLIFTLLRRRSGGAPLLLIVFLLFPILYFGWVGSWFAKFNRYTVPFLPFVTLAGAWFCVVWIKRFRVSGILFTTLLVTATLLWGLANWTVYVRPQTRFTATEWMFQHIPAGSTIYTEHWNDGLPLDIPNAVPYHRELLTVYDPDNEMKREYYASKLVAGDYIILSTRRMWATMPRLGEKYPLTKLFYQRLLDGTLGYRKVAVFTSYPQLLGIVVNDDGAEESLQVFDHPTVLIFQNTGHYTYEELFNLLRVQ